MGSGSHGCTQVDGGIVIIVGNSKFLCEGVSLRGRRICIDPVVTDGVCMGHCEDK